MEPHGYEHGGISSLLVDCIIFTAYCIVFTTKNTADSRTLLDDDTNFRVVVTAFLECLSSRL